MLDMNINIPNDWIDGDVENHFTLLVNSDDYAPYFNRGDILIGCKDFSKLEENDVRIYQINGGFELRKYIITTNGTKLLEGLTGYIPPLIDLGGFELIGFVYIRITNYRKGAVNNE